MDSTMTRRIGFPRRLMTFEGSKGSKLRRLEGFEASRASRFQRLMTFEGRPFEGSRTRGAPKVDYLLGSKEGCGGVPSKIALFE